MSATLPFVTGSETSFQAARRAHSSAGSWRTRVLVALDSVGEGGLTDEELQTRLGLNPSTQRPRRVELVHFGVIRDSGRTRPTRSGKQATVWISVDESGHLVEVTP